MIEFPTVLHVNLNAADLADFKRQWDALPRRSTQIVLIPEDSEITDLRRQLAAMTAERDQALADVRLLTLAKDHWRRIAMENDPSLQPSNKEQSNA